jgi:acyl-CoA synthetase (AMP-forming)/AMP-acid ligase II
MLHPTRTITEDFEEQGLWQGETLSAVLDRAIARDAGHLALVDGRTRLTYGELGAAVDRMVAHLTEIGVGPGDVVLAQLPNWWEAVALLHAVARVGAVINPVVTIYREAELGFIVAQAAPKAIVVPEVFRGYDHLAMIQRVLADRPGADRPAVLVARPERPLPPDVAGTLPSAETGDRPETTPDRSAPNDVLLLLYTSGTTAAPKGVLHNHQTLIYECRSIAQLFDLRGGEPVFMPSPLTHITGLLYGLILPPLLGSVCVLMDVWEPDAAVALIEEHGCEFSVAATPFLSGLTAVYEKQGTASALRQFGCGGADVPPELIRRATDVLRANVVRLYGSSEMPTFSGARTTDDLRAKAETDGFPIGPVEGRVVDAVYGVGELLVRGPELFLGYLDPALNEDSFTADGYFRTGDLAAFDSEGFVTIKGRIKDIIIRNGEKISAREIEDMLYQHPAVVDAAIVGVPDPELGERACAVVVPELSSRPTLAELCEFLAGFHVAKQKLPEDLELVDELPRNAAGKVQKFLLRERLAASLR